MQTLVLAQNGIITSRQRENERYVREGRIGMLDEALKFSDAKFSILLPNYVRYSKRKNSCAYTANNFTLLKSNNGEKLYSIVRS